MARQIVRHDMKFLVNWNLQGFRDKVHHAEDVIEADLKEVEQWVAKEFGGLVHHKGDAVLTPVEGDVAPKEDESTEPAVVPGGDVDLSKLKKEELVAHAAKHHDLQLDPTIKKDDMITAIDAARTAAASEQK